MNWKYILIIIIIAVITCGGILAYHYWWTSFWQPLSLKSETVLEFSTGQCDSSVDPYSQPDAEVISQKWLNEGTLLVEGYLKTFCDGAEIRGSHEVKGNNLILKYKIEISGPVTECNCTHKLIYKILKLERENYQISLIEDL